MDVASERHLLFFSENGRSLKQRTKGTLAVLEEGFPWFNHLAVFGNTHKVVELGFRLFALEKKDLGSI